MMESDWKTKKYEDISVLFLSLSPSHTILYFQMSNYKIRYVFNSA